MIKSLSALALAIVCSGCLWVCRVPFPVKSSYSDEGECTNRVWRSAIADFRKSTNDDVKCDVNGIYPLTKMRCYATYSSFKDVDTANLKGRDLYEAKMRNRWLWIPGILIWIGEPLDIVVDTVLIPWDL